jgi:hypothetical protein
MNDNDPPGGNLALTTEIVSAYVANHAIAPADLPDLITGVLRALNDTGRVEEAAPEKPEPAVPVRKSVGQDFIVCLEDGKKLKAAEAVPGDALRHDARGVPEAVGPAERLPDGGARLRRAPLDARQAVRPGPQAGGGSSGGAAGARASARARARTRVGSRAREAAYGRQQECGVKLVVVFAPLRSRGPIRSARGPEQALGGRAGSAGAASVIAGEGGLVDGRYDMRNAERFGSPDGFGMLGSGLGPVSP